MGSRKAIYVTIALSILLFLSLLIAQQTFQKTNIIVLPEHSAETDTNSDTVGSVNFSALSISPRTVRAAIRTLSRPAAYERTQTIEMFWGSGKNTATFQVAVNGDLTRLDTTLIDGSVRHTLIHAETAAVWYDEENTWKTIQASEFSSDTLQRIPTYETVLNLSVARIAQAEYCEKNGVWCIYVQTQINTDGYTDHYWVSAETGLLFVAERYFKGDLIYRFTATEPQNVTPDDSLFLLPDGSHF